MNLGLRAAAKELGIRHPSLLKAVASGRVKRNKDGTFDVEACRRALAENSNLPKQRAARSQQKKAASGVVTRVVTGVVTAPDQQEPPADDAQSYNEACRQREWLRVRQAQLDLDEAEGRLIPTEEAKRAWGAMVAAFRTRMLAIPSKLGPKVAVEDDAVTCQAMILSDVEEALAELAKYQPKPNA